MKKLKLIVSMALLSASTFAQDLIVTTDNDSLNCKIMKVDEAFIQFAYSDENGEVKRTLISQESIASYQIAYFDTPAIPLTKTRSTDTDEDLNWKVGFRGGYSWRTVGTDGDRYANPAKHGPHLGMDFAYFFNNYVGLGGLMTYYYNSVNNKEYNFKQNSLFAGPNLTLRLTGSDYRNAFISEYAIGYFGLWENDVYLRQSGLFETIGFFCGIGYERSVKPNLLMGGKISILAANIPLSGNNWLNASRLDFSVYVAFNTNKK